MNVSRAYYRYLGGKVGRWSLKTSLYITLPHSPWGMDRRIHMVLLNSLQLRLNKTLLVDYYIVMLQGGAPPVRSWFIVPLTIDISTINPSY
jgi:hypothetical protein